MSTIRALANLRLTMWLASKVLKRTGDLVRCHQCGIGLKDFSPEDDPLTEHIKHADNCDYLIDVYGVAGLEEKRCLINDPDNIRRRQLASFQAQKAPETTYRRPEYASYDARLATFEGWPEEASQRPHQLADAGLYFAESILEENARLKHIFKCSKCNVNDINALFLPCAHHRMCMDCASKYDVTVCPVCDRPIREIIKTYMESHSPEALGGEILVRNAGRLPVFSENTEPIFSSRIEPPLRLSESDLSLSTLEDDLESRLLLANECLECELAGPSLPDRDPIESRDSSILAFLKSHVSVRLSNQQVLRGSSQALLGKVE
ncbi:BIR7B-like protein [Mya arenaria]|uniref:BIR7B-like protein n=1 Tax=Mya arenaria TaxID=6604 RepID=A0ABY7ED60_MYAAR|nr:BIR7B-like protein [Mya arenaria]